MKFSPKEIAASRDPDCVFSEDDILEALEARFPGARSIDASELIASWLADRKLPQTTLRNCALTMRKLTGIRGPRAMLDPRGCLETIAAALQAPPSETTDNA